MALTIDQVNAANESIRKIRAAEIMMSSYGKTFQNQNISLTNHRGKPELLLVYPPVLSDMTSLLNEGGKLLNSVNKEIEVLRMYPPEVFQFTGKETLKSLEDAVIIMKTLQEKTHTGLSKNSRSLFFLGLVLTFRV